MKTIYGDILDIKQGIIIQQVNCKGVMGAGLAKQIRDKYPRVFSDYKKHIALYKENNLEHHLLGSINSTSLVEHGITIYNFFSQDTYGKIGRYTDYKAFENCLIKLLKRFKNSKVDPKDFDVYFPYGIGCGLAGGDWSIISNLIEKYFPNAIIVKYNK